MRLLVFASGRGSNFEAIVEASKKNYLHSQVIGLLCDKECPAMEIAKKNSIPVSIIKPKDYQDKSIYIKTLLDVIKRYKPDYIILAGYMRILPAELIDEYPLKVINIHPSLLPQFPGKDSIAKAWDSGVKITGVTVHYVNDRMDAGPIIAQEFLKISDNMKKSSGLEKLENKIHKIEHRIYPASIKKLTEEPFDTLVVSKCLTGVNCRYDGGSKLSKRVKTFIKNFNGKIVDICPELEAGFDVPRPTTDIINGKAMMKGVGDITEKLENACNKIISRLSGSKKILAILKEKSPSCGVRSPKGIFASCVEKTLNVEKGSGVFIVSEEDL
ncbi:MAG: phosphoribosylglycinamide formyltransferase [Proteobacteria bacterium]|nr:phosphoribosylglycinamide formyltransferase [Pseudomonadota bacterium]